MKNKIFCTLCSTHYKPEEINFNFNYQEIVKCPKCGTGKFIKTPEEIKALWDNEFEGICYGLQDNKRR